MTGELDILVIGAHADDAEIGMGGTIAKHVAAGFRVGICDLTYSEMSSNGNVERRKEEASAAAQALGLAERSCLGLPDRGLYCCPEQIAAVALEIRRTRPRLVFAPYWEDRHPDHVVCGQIVEQAVFSAKLRRFHPEVAPVTAQALYYYFINDIGRVDMMVDVTTVYESKRKALHAYASQFTDAAPDQDIVATPLNDGYLERVELRDRMLGMKRQVTFAEGFASKLPHMAELFL